MILNFISGESIVQICCFEFVKITFGGSLKSFASIFPLFSNVDVAISKLLSSWKALGAILNFSLFKFSFMSKIVSCISSTLVNSVILWYMYGSLVFLHINNSDFVILVPG
jgi:hypothetical protein